MLRKSNAIVWLMMLVQFTGMTDFMVTMPLGPDIAQSLSISVEKSAWLSGCYAVAAAIAGLALTPWLDRYNRKLMLSTVMFFSGLCLCMTPMVQSFSQLLCLRTVVGFLSTPLAALTVAIVIDSSETNRGQAMAKLSLGFSLSAVIGVPAGLFIAHTFHWTEFYLAIGLLTIIMAIAIYLKTPESSAKNTHAEGLTITSAIKHSDLRNGLLIMVISLFAAFLFIPHLAAIFEYNFGYPREQMGTLYFLGGLATIPATLMTGRTLTNKNSFPRLLSFTCLSAIVLVAGFSYQALSVIVIFVLFMSLNGARNLIIQTLLSQLPQKHQRAGYLGLLTTVRNITTGVAAFLSAQILSTTSEGRLENVTVLVAIALLFMMSTLLLVRFQTKRPDLIF